MTQDHIAKQKSLGPQDRELTLFEGAKEVKWININYIIPSAQDNRGHKSGVMHKEMSNNEPY